MNNFKSTDTLNFHPAKKFPKESSPLVFTQNFRKNQQFFSSDTHMQTHMCLSGGEELLFLENFA